MFEHITKNLFSWQKNQNSSQYTLYLKFINIFQIECLGVIEKITIILVDARIVFY